MNVEHGSSVKELVTTLFADWEAGDMAPFFRALSEDVRWTAIGTTPISGIYSGKEEYLKQCYRPIMKLFAGPVKCTVRRIVSDGEHVVVCWLGETPTAAGGVYRQDYCWSMTVNEGRIVEVYGYFDTAAVNELCNSAH